MEVFADQNFIMTDEQYSSGIMLDEYNGRYSLVNSWMSKDSEVVKKWGYVEKDKKPGKKLPWLLNLGDREQAIEVLQGLLRLLNAEPEGPMRLPDHNDSQPGANEYGDIPF